MRAQHLRQSVPVAILAAGSLLVPTVLMAPSAGAGVTAKGSTATSSGAKSSSSTTSSSKSSKATKSSQGDKKNASGLSSGAAAGLRAHIVVSGDTVVGIAKQYGVSPDSVRAANGIVGDALYLGARVIIDGSAGAGTGASSATTSKSATSSKSAKGSTAQGSSSSKRSGGAKSSKDGASTRIAVKSTAYTIVDGDTLSGIADDHGVSLKALLAANDLKASSLILPGDRISVPAESGVANSAGGSSGSGGATDTSSTGSSDATTSGAGSSTSASNGPNLRCPVPGATFMNDWGFPRDDGGRYHEGTDMFARKGATIVAPAAGTIVFGKNGLGGNTFTIQTASGWEIYGAHLNSTIGSSRSVKAGEAIATVGNSGNAAGGDTHLHMGLKRIGGRSMNPYPSLRSACG